VHVRRPDAHGHAETHRETEPLDLGRRHQGVERRGDLEPHEDVTALQREPRDRGGQAPVGRRGREAHVLGTDDEHRLPGQLVRRPQRAPVGQERDAVVARVPARTHHVARPEEPGDGRVRRPAQDVERPARLVQPAVDQHGALIGQGEGFGLFGILIHGGQDFATSIGTPVYSTGDGVVVQAEYKSNGYGNQIVIDHGYGYQTRYAHLSAFYVEAGQSVNKGDTVGLCGSTGNSTGPHLHFEVIINGVRYNPQSYLP